MVAPMVLLGGEQHRSDARRCNVSERNAGGRSQPLGAGDAHRFSRMIDFLDPYPNFC
jgi:hypothetical protein